MQTNIKNAHLDIISCYSGKFSHLRASSAQVSGKETKHKTSIG